MRQRAISAAVLVPVLLIVLALGGAVLAGGHRARHGRSPRVEVFRLLRPPGTRRSRRSGTALALAIVLDAAFPTVLEGSGLLLGGRRHRARRGRRVREARPARRPRDLDGDDLRRALRLAAVVRHPARARRARRSRPTRRSPASARSAAWILAADPRRSGRTTPARTSSASSFGRTKFLTHISPSKTYEGLVGGDRRDDRRGRASLLWALGQIPLHALVLGPLTALAAQAGDLAESIIKRAAGAKDSGDAHPGPRRHARPRRLVPVRGAGRDPVCRRRPPLRAGGARRAGRAARLDRVDRPPGGRRPRGAPRRVPGRGPRRRARTRRVLDEQARSGRGVPARPARRWTCRRHGRSARRARGRSRRATTSTSSSSRPAASSACGRSSPRSRAGKVVATANKETLVAGGHLVMPLARRLAAAVAAARPARPVREPAGLAPADRLGALGDLAVPRRRADGRRRRARS